MTATDEASSPERRRKRQEMKMKIKYETECWREEVINHLDCEHLSDAETDALADRLCAGVIDLLRRNGVEVERAYGQKVGAFVIVQEATDNEHAEFDTALDAALESLRR